MGGPERWVGVGLLEDEASESFIPTTSGRDFEASLLRTLDMYLGCAAERAKGGRGKAGVSRICWSLSCSAWHDPRMDVQGHGSKSGA